MLTKTDAFILPVAGICTDLYNRYTKVIIMCIYDNPSQQYGG